MKFIVVSACLCGVKCRYDAASVKELDIDKDFLSNGYCPILICPEQLGGLSTPRNPAEIHNGRVIDKNGNDVSENFKKGADETLRIAGSYGVNLSVLKDKSPSCGVERIYDGSFSNRLISGRGLTTKLLMNSGIRVLTVDEFRKTM